METSNVGREKCQNVFDNYLTFKKATMKVKVTCLTTATSTNQVNLQSIPVYATFLNACDNDNPKWHHNNPSTLSVPTSMF